MDLEDPVDGLPEPLRLVPDQLLELVEDQHRTIFVESVQLLQEAGRTGGEIDARWNLVRRPEEVGDELLGISFPTRGVRPVRRDDGVVTVLAQSFHESDVEQRGLAHSGLTV